MSDGERAIFYFLGTCLVAKPDSVLIIDEPESHVHRAILRPLWSAIEKARKDCAFIYITHDLDFAAEHSASKTYFLREYRHDPRGWEIEELPQDTGLPEHVVAEIVGSRRPILFVEGVRGSLDMTIYDSVYPGFTVIPIGAGCEAVIHAVSSYNRSKALHRFAVYGIVDADDRTTEQLEKLQKDLVYSLGVVEVENLLLWPSVFKALAKALKCDVEKSFQSLTEKVRTMARAELDTAAFRYTERQLNRRLKRAAGEAENLDQLSEEWKKAIAAMDVNAIATEYKKLLEERLKKNDFEGVLKLYDNKGMLAAAAKILKITERKALLEKVGRMLGGEDELDKAFRAELAALLPIISAEVPPATGGETA
jgi:energy-coupling factor transporter ATP-binding protein EcfA2